MSAHTLTSVLLFVHPRWPAPPTIAHARPHGWPRLFVQLLAAMDFSCYPSVIHLGTVVPKCFPTVSSGLAALRVQAHGVCRFPFSTYLVAGLLPPMRVSGLLNMRAYMYAQWRLAQWPWVFSHRRQCSVSQVTVRLHGLAYVSMSKNAPDLTDVGRLLGCVLCALVCTPEVP